MVEAYHEQISGETPLAPPTALEAMATGKVDGADAAAARVFVAYKGTYPLGSAIRLSTGRNGVVVAHPKTGPRDQPTVALIESSGRLGQRVDLSIETTIQITGVMSSQEAGINLTQG